MLFSILICFRNRESERVKRCLDSLNNQTIKIFEVIFVDYGSTKELANEIQILLKNYPFVSYIYNDTRGLPWNQPHALNTGLLKAKGEFIVRLDVDLILPPNFFEVIQQKINKNSYFHSRTYFLTPEFTDYQNLFQKNKKQNKFKVSNDYYLGLLMIINREFFLSINGFDEYYSFWGHDDLDMSKRIQNEGKTLTWLDINDLPVFHQYHPPSGSKNPTGYQRLLINHFENSNYNKLKNIQIGKTFSLEERPALNLYLTKGYLNHKRLEIASPKINSFLKIANLIVSENEEKTFYLDTNEGNNNSLIKSKNSKLVSNANKFLDKLSLPFNLVEARKDQNETLTNYEIADFLFYLTLNFADFIEDYYLDNNKNYTICIIKKK